ncbi:unnamed protein product [Didymodactylos carnosus]|uniref:Uncharacterized protein n=1 Tax=Didymodactylos carnosus TaxID=1234261 RepID=A0A813QMU3_9BILA|nr:unnamed protein product [Didymodactylos carnosus]CAF1008818.1 unnamed protein product [Didymodactylos carnosus]CAF3551057.1 unnamed protein product [Didymodactylos carnosus]CAF3777773.1 unnamed protein product [Didymodactylos carnosus]
MEKVSKHQIDFKTTDKDIKSDSAVYYKWLPYFKDNENQINSTVLPLNQEINSKKEDVSFTPVISTNEPTISDFVNESEEKSPKQNENEEPEKKKDVPFIPVISVNDPTITDFVAESKKKPPKKNENEEASKKKEGKRNGKESDNESDKED